MRILITILRVITLVLIVPCLSFVLSYTLFHSYPDYVTSSSIFGVVLKHYLYRIPAYGVLFVWVPINGILISEWYRRRRAIKITLGIYIFILILVFTLIYPKQELVDINGMLGEPVCHNKKVVYYYSPGVIMMGDGPRLSWYCE